MEIRVSLMNKQGKLESKIVKTELNDFNVIIDRFKVHYNTYVEHRDLDMGFVLLDNGLIIEDIEKYKRYKEMLKYM